MNVFREALKHKIPVILLAILLITNLLWLTVNVSRHQNESEWITKHPLLSKRLAVEQRNDTLINFDPLRQQVKNYLANINIPHSFYFEYLPSGINIRDGDENETVAASLMKIPVVIDLYQAAEKGKIELDKNIMLNPNDVSKDPLFGTPSGILPGSEISPRQLAEKTLTASDNTAARVILNLVRDHLPENDWAINNLDLRKTTRNNQQGQFVLISSGEYSTFLKCLYLSCLLEPEDSQEILNYLAMSDNTSRIPTGVPDSIKVANKIGSFSNQVQSDCGIVYEPNRPYLVCMMLFTKANDADKYFKDISKMIYEYVSQAQ